VLAFPTHLRRLILSLHVCVVLVKIPASARSKRFWLSEQCGVSSATGAARLAIESRVSSEGGSQISACHSWRHWYFLPPLL
jgi:hypothetical protein